MSERRFLKTAFQAAALVFLLLGTATAQGVGAIGGTVQDESGAVLPGVTVTLSNPGIIGGNQTAITNASGAYQFSRLVPSTYSVKAVLQGFRTAVQDRLVVNADTTARADLTLQIGTVEESVTVTREAPLLDTSAVLNQTVLTREVLDALPTGRDVWAIGLLVPGVVMNRYDIGGTGSFAQSVGTVHGSSQGEGMYLIDGMEVSWPAGAGNSVSTYWDSNMYEEVNYQAGNAPAENQRGGLVYNMITRTGTNKFLGSFSYTGSSDALQSNNVSSALRAQLLAAVPAKVLAANPSIEPGNKILRLFDYAGTASGPVVKDRLWFSATWRYQRLDQNRLGSYNLDGTLALDDNLIRNVSSKASWQVNNGNQLHYTFNYNFKGNFHGLPTSDFRDDKATNVRAMTGYVNQLKWTSLLSPRLALDTGISLMLNNNPNHPQPDVKPGDIARRDAVTTERTGAQGVYTDQPNYRGSVVASLSYVVGNHNVKTGYQFGRGHENASSYSMSHYPSGLLAITRNGVPDSVNTYNTPAAFKSFMVDHGWFAQDKWSPARKLTLNLGLRVQKTRGWMPAACQQETIFIKGQCYGAVEDAPNWLDVSPRFGMIYDVFGNGKTALKLAANHYNLGTGLAFTLRVNPIQYSNDTRSWTDRNRDLIPQLDELGPSTGFNLGNTNHYNPDLKRPYVDELSAEIEQQLFRDVVLSAGYYRRNTRRDIGGKNLLVPRESYIPLQVIERSSGQAVTVYNQSAALRGQFDVLYDNFAEMDSNFNGVDVTVNKRLGSGWMVMSGLSAGKNIGDTYGTPAGAGTFSAGDLNDPNNTFRSGVVGTDSTLVFKAAAIYVLPYQIFLSGSLQHLTGFPENDTVTVASNTVALTQVNQSVRINPRGTNRLPDLNVLDLAVKKTVKFRNFSAEPVVELFNALNDSTVLGRVNVLGSAYQRANNILRGRLVKVGVYLRF